MKVDLSHLPGDVRAAFHAQRAAAEAATVRRAIRNQHQIARTFGEHRSLEGIGAADMAVDPVVHAAWERQEGQGIWGERSFRRRMKREFPELRVKSIGTKIQVGWNGAAPSEAGWIQRGSRSIKIYR